MKLKNLYERLVSRISTFTKLGDTLWTPNGPLIHIDNGAKVLAVGHLDYVYKSQPIMSGNSVICPQLDDRLGVWTILDFLPSIGVKCDVLLTDSEESGMSTAEYFVAEKDYNWVFEFDRCGTDVVMYQFGTQDLDDLLTSMGWKVGTGSLSDISSMDHLGVSCFNFGVGYHMQHTYKCHADVKVTVAQARRFAKFYHKYKNTRMDHVEDNSYQWRNSFSFGYYGRSDAYDYYGNGGTWSMREEERDWQAKNIEYAKTYPLLTVEDSKGDSNVLTDWEYEKWAREQESSERDRAWEEVAAMMGYDDLEYFRDKHGNDLGSLLGSGRLPEHE
jgi:hypothetical protein